MIHFLHNSRIGSSQFRSFLTQRPKYLAYQARNSLSESTEIVKSSKFNYFNCHLLSITMTVYLFLLIHSLFILYRLSIQTCNRHSNSSFDVADVQIITSSAYIFSTQASTEKLGISLMHNMNKIGPATDPCGTPHVISHNSDVSWWKLTNCLRPLR